jgi:hypothetical protein
MLTKLESLNTLLNSSNFYFSNTSICFLRPSKKSIIKLLIEFLKLKSLHLANNVLLVINKFNFESISPMKLDAADFNNNI